jgi:Uma2 family endonuclease
MNVATLPELKKPIEYPESDGEPIGDNTLQFEWIVTIAGGLQALFASDPNVFVAGNLLWYPVEGSPKVRTAPDAMVVFGRPKGHRSSYLQWEEGNVPPQVVFEVVSPRSRDSDLLKTGFYDRYGVEEYYIYDPYPDPDQERSALLGLYRSEGGLSEIETMDGWESPRLKVRFQMGPDGLELYAPNGERFSSYVELELQRTEAKLRAAESERRATQNEERAKQSEERAARLAAQLKALGIQPDE